MISIEEALRRVLLQVPDSRTEVVELQFSEGRVLAEDVASDVDIPPFHRSAMDGFAVRSKDIRQVPMKLECVGEVPAGSISPIELKSGQVVSIMTGAPVPAGADSVVRVEDTSRENGGNTVRFEVAAPEGMNIEPQGRITKVGHVVLPAGTCMVPAAIGVAAMVGRSRVRVFARPRIAFVSTGDELVEIDRVPEPGQIRNSNRYTIESMARCAGAEVVWSRLLPDDLEVTRTTLREAVGHIDVLLFSGGVSMGEYDFVHRAMHAENVEMQFEKVAVKPGKPLSFGRAGTTMIFGLPGNPVSSFITFLLFVGPALRKMSGRKDISLATIRARLESDKPLRGANRVQYLPARLESNGEEGWVVHPLPWAGSADLCRLVDVDGFLEVPIQEEPLESGCSIRVIVSKNLIGGGLDA